MPYRIAGIDVHKKMLAVVVADVEIDDALHFDRQKVGTTPADHAPPGGLRRARATPTPTPCAVSKFPPPLAARARRSWTWGLLRRRW